MWKSVLATSILITAAMTSATVDINQATVADLDSIRGIGPAVSARILDERKNGQFRDWNDLITRVKGLGRGNAARLSSEGLNVNGVAFLGAPGSTTRKTSDASTANAQEKK